jgi:hypothetical protein
VRIEFTRSGGLAGRRTRVALDLDELPAAERNAIESLVERAGFFDLPAECLSPRPDAFQYTVTIEAEGRRHCVRADDLGAPPHLRPLLERLARLAR